MLPTTSPLRFVLLLWWLTCAAQALFAQPYPVTAIVQVTQFSPYLESYAQPGRVMVTLLSTDARPEYPVLVRYRLSGPGFSLHTPDTYLPMPLVLRRGQPLVLTGPAIDLTGLDNPAGTLGQGLPGGPVSLCVEVYDYQRFFDPPVSNTACAQGLIQLHRPASS